MSAIAPAITRYLQRVRATRVQLLAFVMAVWLTSNFPVALAINPSFPTEHAHARTVHLLFIPITVNGWHAVFHLVTGAAGLYAVRTRRGATTYAAAAAVIYLATAFLCAMDWTVMCRFMAVDTFGNVVHALEGLTLAAIAAYALIGNSATRVARTPHSVTTTEPS
ncbi:DUF4383 domain-containing protein [Nocardia suismassiliense]|uniref:DUF4383 domain-containing protein n=1 Tax=Nocardia suismassiliense TaxID=2077092 RepID=UPI000D1E7E1A|nr:DUF4383 domain-containing protein [Nocardia suismassiliense]